jgi:uncharacterized membrane protein (UPF0127 family)
MRSWALVFCFAVAGCRRDPPSNGNSLRVNSADPTAETYVGPTLPMGKVLLRDAYGGTHLVEVEIAATAAARNRGMMWRRELPEGKGMLFLFPNEAENTFWMRNTFIPLDLIFINQQRKVVGIVPQAAPKTLTTRSVGRPSLYVLEVPGGWAEKQGITVGSEVEIQGASMLPVEP